jgi:hypothetical protein
MQAAPSGAQMPQLALQQYWPTPQLWPPQLPGSGVFGTHAHTLGDGSKCAPIVHNAFCTQVQSPPQSAPPLFGSQLSLGSSTQRP